VRNGWRRVPLRVSSHFWLRPIAEDLVETGSVVEARAKGKARLEGKEYVMQDGDVVEFRHGGTSGAGKK